MLLGLCIWVMNPAQAQYLNAPERVDQEKLLALVNKARAEGCRCGGQRMPPVAPLTWSPKLTQVAQGHSNWMYNANTFSHTGVRNSSSGDRLRAAGYRWSAVGENIAKGQTTEEKVMESWLSSPGHCKNIMNGMYTEMGAATRGPYWTQVFATPL